MRRLFREIWDRQRAFCKYTLSGREKVGVGKKCSRKMQKEAVLSHDTRVVELLSFKGRLMMTGVFCLSHTAWIYAPAAAATPASASSFAFLRSPEVCKFLPFMEPTFPMKR